MRDFVSESAKAGKEYAADIRALNAIANRLMSTAEGIRTERIKGKEKLQKLATVEKQLDKVFDSTREARVRYEGKVDAIDEEIANRFEALCSYAKHTGQDDAGCNYLLGEIKSFRQAKGNFALRRSVSGGFADIAAAIADAKEGRKAKVPDADEQTLATFESIADATERSEFYKGNREQIVAGLSKRQARAQS
jgi:hypothetical protein